MEQPLTPHNQTQLGTVRSSPIVLVHPCLWAFPSSAKNTLPQEACGNCWDCEMWEAVALGRIAGHHPLGQFLPRPRGSLGMRDTQVPPSGQSCRDVTSLRETQGAGRPEALAHLPGPPSVADFRGNVCPWNFTFSSRSTPFLRPPSGTCRWQSGWLRAERLGNRAPFLPRRLSIRPTTPPSRASSGLWASSQASQSLAVFPTR